LVFVSLSLFLIAGLTYAAMRSPIFTVQQVRVVGAETLDQSDLVQRSDLRGKNMLRLPLDEALARLREQPQIKSVSVSRAWPNALTIKVEERLPFAYWSVAGRDYVVDREGYVLAAGAPAGPAPQIVEPDQARILGPGDRVQPDAVQLADRIFQEAPLLYGQGVRQLEYRVGIGVTAVFNSGLRVTFGDERGYEYKLAVLSALLERLGAQGVRPNQVDLRFGERVTYE
jgi:cell division protein FtsQ